METLQTQEKTGLTGDGLRAWGLIALGVGAAGKCLIQRAVLGLDSMTGTQLLQLLGTSDSAMALVTVALVLQAVECCAVPIFAFLLTEGFRNTQNLTGYLARVLALAVAAELPFNLAFHGSLFCLTEQNPVFGALLALVVLCFYRQYPGKQAKVLLIKLVVTLAALVWAGMLHIAYAGPMVVLTAVLWAFRAKPMLRGMLGACAAVLCCLMDPFFLAAPMSFLAIHGYNGRQGQAGKTVRYVAYPTILLVVWLCTMVMP